MKKFIVLATLSLFIGQSVMAGGCNLAAANGQRKGKASKIKSKTVKSTKAGKVGG